MNLQQSMNPRVAAYRRQHPSNGSRADEPIRGDVGPASPHNSSAATGATATATDAAKIESVEAQLVIQVGNFLRCEAFSTDVLDLHSDRKSKPELPNSADKETLSEALWYASLKVDERGKKQYNKEKISAMQWDEVYKKIATDIIQYYNNNNNNQNFDLSAVASTWKLTDDDDDVHVKLFLLEVFIRRNRNALLKLLRSNPTTLLAVAKKSFEKVLSNSTDLYNFYNGRSVVVMSPALRDYASARFVCPEDGIFPSHLDSKSSTAEPSYDKVNIIGGWSGAGKTCAATLPSTTSKTLICIVVGVNIEIFDEKHPYSQEFPTVEKQNRNDHHIAAHRSNELRRRDEHALKLLIKAVLSSFGDGNTDIGYASTKTFKNEEKTDHNGEKITVDVPDLCEGKYFNDDTEKRLRRGVNDQLKGNYQIRIVLDEVGLFPEFLSAVCKMWTQLRQYLAKIWKVDQSQFYLFIVGCGTESAAVSPQGSYSSDYAVFVSSARLFFSMLKSLATKSDTDKKTKIYNEIYNFLHPSSSAPSSSQTHDVRTFRQLVEDNARCAALAIRKIAHLARQDHATAELLINHFSAWCLDISAEFIKLNGLNLATFPFWEIGKALRIVMSRRKDLDPEEHRNFLVQYGILVPTKNKLNEKFVSVHEPPFLIQQAFVIMFLLHYSLGFSSHYINVNDSFEHLVALHHALCLVLRLGETSLTDENPLARRLFDGVKLTPGASVETVVLRSKLSDGNYTKEETKLFPANEAETLLLGGKRVSLRQKFLGLQNAGSECADAAADSPPRNVEALRWKEVVKNGGAVVIINGSEAPFADVIVLTHKKLFLTQCKYYEPKKQLTPAERKVEYDKMLFSRHNVFTRELLRECCIIESANENINDVKVVASIFILFGTQQALNNSEDAAVAEAIEESYSAKWKFHNSDDSPFDEKFKFSKVFIPVLHKLGSQQHLQKHEVDRELYPLLIAPLDYDHLEKAAKDVVSAKKTRATLSINTDGDDSSNENNNNNNNNNSNRPLNPPHQQQLRNNNMGKNTRVNEK